MALRIAFPGMASFACALLLSVIASSGQANAQQGTKPNSTAHVYAFTGLGGIGRSYFDGIADKVRQRGMPTTVANAGEMSSVAASTIASYRSGRLRSIIIVGYSMGGGPAVNMAAELGQPNVPAQLVLPVDPVAAPEISPHVRPLI